MHMWLLEGDFNDDGNPTHHELHDLPIILGRDESLNYPIREPSVSRSHAKLDTAANDKSILIIADLESSNGTFVNRQRIKEDTVINHGDIIHLGTLEIRLIDTNHLNTAKKPSQQLAGSTMIMPMPAENLSEKYPAGVMELEKLIDNQLVYPVFQAIIRSDGLKTIGYELLGRGKNPKLTPNPAELFRIAASVGLDVKLSTLMRNIGIDQAASHKVKGIILMNTHPKELEDQDKLMHSLIELRKRHPSIPLMLEIHEEAVTKTGNLAQLKKVLSKLNIRLAFDDFGVGQSRLLEMIDAKPDLVKFDRALIDQIDKDDSSRLNLLKHLRDMVKSLGIKTLAECVSCEAEYKTCDSIGFDFYQGFYFGMPTPAEDLEKK